ncbi:hypothetical protein QBC38DRAFT_506274 [Podospora fimiseda]|uniref:Dol-P-Man:Man(5)GlcNAc(2)-PP-Dol alpha-1,3-mannosyltransferase n=1 Tax=Podospora fimiseda TaxID=252190 RepID=A0AAN7BYD8_9PEZI|nr:hypothetical protein QBC38DRAFT_506274 [Podospora fimiseda]
MSKISPALKVLIESPSAKPNTTPAPAWIRDVYSRILLEGRQKQYGIRPFVALAAATTFTLNSPASLVALHSITSSTSPFLTPLSTAELIREIGLKCISFNGIPRTINCLGEFRQSMAVNPWSKQLSTIPTRQVNSQNINSVKVRGQKLWDSIYTPFETKLVAKLAESHPDLPVHILGSHYGPLLANPPETEERRKLGSVGRCLTSVVAIACLRAQSGVGPQVLSHVYGLKKGIEQGWAEKEYGGGAGGMVDAGETEALRKLGSDEGLEWILTSVDKIAKAISGLRGNFASVWELNRDEEVVEGEIVKKGNTEEGVREVVDKEEEEVRKVRESKL